MSAWYQSFQRSQKVKQGRGTPYVAFLSDLVERGVPPSQLAGFPDLDQISETRMLSTNLRTEHPMVSEQVIKGYYQVFFSARGEI